MSSTRKNKPWIARLVPWDITDSCILAPALNQYLCFCSGAWWRCCGSAVWQSAWCLCTHCSGHWLCPALWCEHCSIPHSGRYWGWRPLHQTPDTPVLQSGPGTHFRVMYKFAIMHFDPLLILSLFSNPNPNPTTMQTWTCGSFQLPVDFYALRAPKGILSYYFCVDVSLCTVRNQQYMVGWHCFMVLISSWCRQKKVNV